MRWQVRIRDAEDWRQVRARGHNRWVVRQGLIGWGVPIILVVLVTQLLFFGSDIARPWWVVLLVLTVLGTSSGYIVADKEWHRAERKFGDRG